LEWCQVQTDVESAPQFGTALEQNSVAQTSGTSMAAVINLVTLEVAAKKSRHADLWFLIPDDFFEGQDALQGNKEKQLNFRGCLSIYASQSPSQALSPHPIQESNFELNVRPQSTYTTFLPTVYQEVDYIHRFIKIFEQAFDPVVNSFTSMWAHLDPLTAPQALLPFLAHWVDWSIDAQIDLTHQRRLIRRAVEIYRCRGTRKGLRFYLHLYTGLPLDEHIDREEDKSISITEPFGQGCLFGLAHVGEDAIIGGGKPYHFDVRLRTQPNSAIDEQLVRRIIDQEKPAFCSYSLRIETDHY
jgi:phage tail-like protein